jgi:hypothetical protein
MSIRPWTAAAVAVVALCLVPFASAEEGVVGPEPIAAPVAPLPAVGAFGGGWNGAPCAPACPQPCCRPCVRWVPPQRCCVQRQVEVPARTAERCTPVFEDLQVPVYTTRCEPVWREVQVPVYACRQVPVTRTVCDPCTGEVSTVPCGVRTEHYVAEMRTERVRCGTRVERVQCGTRTVRRLAGMHRETVVVCPATTRTVCECACVPGRWEPVGPAAGGPAPAQGEGTANPAAPQPLPAPAPVAPAPAGGGSCGAACGGGR